MSRRVVIGTALIAGVAGAAWTSGLAVLSRGTRPQLLVVGRDAWQLILIEDGLRRMLILAGESGDFPADELRRLLGLLRPRVDIIAASRTSLDQIPHNLGGPQSGAHRLVLADVQNAGIASRESSIGSAVDIELGAFDVRFQPVIQREWSAEPVARQWTASVGIGDLTVAIAPSLDLIARHADPATALAIAPTGHLPYLHRLLPRAAVVTNADNVADLPAPSARPVDGAIMLVRTFPRDIARLVVDNDAIALPYWAAHVQLGN